MPRGGSKKGQRRGGREAGTPNKATIEKQRIAAEIAARTIQDAKVQGRKLAKEQLQEFLPVLANYCAFFQPTYPGMPVSNVRSDETKFLLWFDLFLSTARALAPYESATFRAVDLRATLPAAETANPLDVMRALLDDIDDEDRRARAERTQQRIEYVPPAEKKRA